MTDKGSLFCVRLHTRECGFTHTEKVDSLKEVKEMIKSHRNVMDSMGLIHYTFVVSSSNTNLVRLVPIRRQL